MGFWIGAGHQKDQVTIKVWNSTTTTTPRFSRKEENGVNTDEASIKILIRYCLMSFQVGEGIHLTRRVMHPNSTPQGQKLLDSRSCLVYFFIWLFICILYNILYNLIHYLIINYKYMFPRVCELFYQIIKSKREVLGISKL